MICWRKEIHGVENSERVFSVFIHSLGGRSFLDIPEEPEVEDEGSGEKNNSGKFYG